ncbi:MAG: hypothetical protein NVS2B14_06350 [Chamaesiphon sp.]
MKEILLSILQFFGLAWWIQIVTDNPQCTYYFGPFITRKGAESAKGGYIEDLQIEGAQGIEAIVKRCKPHNLTIYDDFADRFDLYPQRSFSGQMS